MSANSKGSGSPELLLVAHVISSLFSCDGSFLFLKCNIIIRRNPEFKMICSSVYMGEEKRIFFYYEYFILFIYFFTLLF